MDVYLEVDTFNLLIEIKVSCRFLLLISLLLIISIPNVFRKHLFIAQSGALSFFSGHLAVGIEDPSL